MIWAGDFNRHHPLWDRDEDTHLFSRPALRAAENLIGLLAEHNMEMALPKGIPTLEHMCSKRYSRPDNFFCTASFREHVVSCDIDPAHRPACTDHLPIATHISLPQSRCRRENVFSWVSPDVTLVGLFQLFVGRYTITVCFTKSPR